MKRKVLFTILMVALYLGLVTASHIDEYPTIGSALLFFFFCPILGYCTFQLYGGEETETQN